MKTSQSFLCAGLLLSVTICHAEEYDSYHQRVANKANYGFMNIVTAPLEIPKNIINLTNESNIVYGVIGGSIQGTLNLLGRVGSGISDLVTAPIPTKRHITPPLVWDNFDMNTEYGEIFRLPDEYEYETRYE